jgi:HK97 family phage portal protein
LAADLYIRNLAFETGVNLIANCISKCEFRTFAKNKETKKEEYYLWNIEPNKNQNSSEFIHKLISRLYHKNEALVIVSNNQLLIADSFVMDDFALKLNTFRSVVVNGYEFKETFTANDVLYFKLNNTDIRTLLNGMYETYGKMITYAQSKYNKSKGTKGVFKVDAIAESKDNFEETYSNYVQKLFKAYFENENAALPLFEGYQWTENQNKVSENSRDIRAMIDDIYELTARALRIPPKVLKGDVGNTEYSVNDLLTFCIDPLSDLLQEEITRKRIGKALFMDGYYVQIDTKTIKHIDLLSVASAIDKLIASGAYCINDIRRAVGDSIIDEPWAWQHWITKNYEGIELAGKEVAIE